MWIEDLSKIVITHVDYTLTVYTKQGAREKEDVRRNWGLKLKRDGKTYYRLPDGRKYLSDNRHLILCPMGSTYEWYSETGGWITNIEFNAEIPGLDDGESNEIFSFNINDNLKVFKILEDMEMAPILSPELCGMIQKKLLYEMLMLLLEKSGRGSYISSGTREKIYPALEYISRFYSSKISNDCLSRQCGISTVYFRKLFTEAFGISPQAYLFRFRMERAKNLLMKRKGMRVSEVAVSVGYDDVYQFSKMFKKYTGVSPKRYFDTQKDRIVWNKEDAGAESNSDWIYEQLEQKE